MATYPIHLTAVLYPQPDKLDTVAAAAADLTKIVQDKEPDVLTYYAFRTESEIIFVEAYKTQEAHEAHVKTDHFQQFFKDVSPLLVKPLEIKQGNFVGGFQQR